MEYFYLFSAARGDHLEVLKWARENGCDWEEYTSIYAASNGHLEVLKWAIENGCPIDIVECVKIAKENNHLNILKYLKE